MNLECRGVSNRVPIQYSLLARIVGGDDLVRGPSHSDRRSQWHLAVPVVATLDAIHLHRVKLRVLGELLPAGPTLRNVVRVRLRLGRVGVGAGRAQQSRGGLAEELAEGGHGATYDEEVDFDEAGRGGQSVFSWFLPGRPV